MTVSNNMPRDINERRAWFAEMRKRMSASPLTVAKQPSGVRCYWARKNDATEMSRLDILGLTVVKEKDKVNRQYQANGLKEDGTYQLGDVILMSCPADVYDFYLEEHRERGEQLVGSIPKAFRAEASKQGVPTFELDERGKPVTKPTLEA